MIITALSLDTSAFSCTTVTKSPFPLKIGNFFRDSPRATEGSPDAPFGVGGGVAKKGDFNYHFFNQSVVL